MPITVKLFKNFLHGIPGNLVIVNSANKWINVYVASEKFSFSNVIGFAKNGDLGIILKNYTDNTHDILYHYVKVVFSSGIVGIVHSGLVNIINIDEEKTF